MVLSFLCKCISWITGLWAMLGSGASRAPGPADMGRLFSKGIFLSVAGQVWFLSRVKLDKFWSKGLSCTRVTAGKYTGTRGRFRHTDCDCRAAQASRIKSKHLCWISHDFREISEGPEGILLCRKSSFQSHCLLTECFFHYPSPFKYGFLLPYITWTIFFPKSNYLLQLYCPLISLLLVRETAVIKYYLTFTQGF